MRRLWPPILLMVLLPATASAEQLLSFSASWCGPCQAMKPRIEALKRQDYPIREVDIDADKATASRYHVDRVPTFVVVDDDGKELGRKLGVQTVQGLAEWANGFAKPDHIADAGNVIEPGVNPDPIKTCVRIRITHGRTTGFGSGTVIHSDASSSTVLTCGHIFQDVGKNPQITVDLFDGEMKTDAHSDKLHVDLAQSVRGERIDADPTLDVGLIRISPGKQIPFAKVVPTHWEPRERMRMTTTGCSLGKNPTLWPTIILNPRQKGVGDRPNYASIECQGTPAQGRSGGGLFTDDGYLAGVCDFAEPQGQHGLYAAPKSIYAVLDHAQLTGLYGKSVGPPSTTAIEEIGILPQRVNETTLRLFQNWCKKNPPPAGPQGPTGPTGPQGPPGTPGPVGAAGTSPVVDLTAILSRLAALEATVAKPITFTTPQPDGTSASVARKLGEELKFKIPSSQALIDRISALEAKVK